MLMAHGATHPGKVRKKNEDSMLWDPDLGLLIVADGMGGHNAGEVASNLAIESVKSFLGHSRDGDCTWPYGIDPAISFNGNRVATALKLANRKVFRSAETNDAYTAMGTTAVVVLVEEGWMTYGSVGDSRIYSLANGKLEQLTVDDTWLAQIAEFAPDATDPAKHNPMRHVLTNVIGGREQAEVKVRERELLDGEVLMLCSDGLHGPLDSDAIARILIGGKDVAATAEQLVAEALEKDGTDNITALVAQYRKG